MPTEFHSCSPLLTEKVFFHYNTLIPYPKFSLEQGYAVILFHPWTAQLSVSACWDRGQLNS